MTSKPALREMLPGTVTQRCWVHKAANVLNVLPKCAQRVARAGDRGDPRRRRPGVRREGDRGVQGELRREVRPKAVPKITDDTEALLAFYDLPAEHCVHRKTSNPIESTFAAVRLRTKVTKGPGSKAAGLAMAFKLIEPAEGRWRAATAPRLVALLRSGARFTKGISWNGQLTTCLVVPRSVPTPTPAPLTPKSQREKAS